MYITDRGNNAFKNSDRRYSTTKEPGFTHFVRSILPPPPDTRKVILKDVTNQITPVVQRTEHNIMTTGPRLEISALNTTLIGDYISAVFPQFQEKWLVQSNGAATFASTLESIKNGVITANRRYVFFQLGGNQIRSADAENTFTNILNIVVKAREQNPASRVFFVGILPRPVEDDHVKTLVMKSNRWIHNAVDRVNSLFGKVKFLPVQLKFLNGKLGPRKELFKEDDQLTLNEAGAAVFKQEVFKLAGFVKNV